MEQLLQITTIPIQVEIQINHAKLNYNNQHPTVQVSRNQGGLTMKADPIRVQIDSQKARDSIGMKTSDTLSKEYGEKGLRVSYQAIAKIVQNGNKLLDGITETKKFTPADLARGNGISSIETALAFLPSASPDFSWEGGKLSIQYQADDLNFDWNTANRAAFEFIPGSVELRVTQWPDVQIEYVGGPIYCPPSADPNYVEPELDVRV